MIIKGTSGTPTNSLFTYIHQLYQLAFSWVIRFLSLIIWHNHLKYIWAYFKLKQIEVYF